MILLFVDNMSVASALVSGHSTQQDIQCLITIYYWLTATYSMTIWIEWVPSKANPADAVSRSEPVDDLHQGTFDWPDELMHDLTYRHLLRLLTSKWLE